MDSQFGSLNLPFCIRHEAGIIEGGFGEIFFLPVSLSIVAQALRLKCFKLRFSTVSFHAALLLLLRCSNSLYAVLVYQE